MNNKKKNMLNNIINAAIPVFAEMPYEEVALSQICQKANISNGTIYNYFSSKEELFKHLLSSNCSRLALAFSKTKGDSIKEKLESFIRINLSMTKKGLDLVTIFRKGQYKFPEYEQQLRQLYISSLEFIFEKKINSIEYLYLAAGIRFIKIQYIKNNTIPDIEFLCNIIMNGIFGDLALDFEKIKSQTLYTITPFIHNNKKFLLLKHGEFLFGKHGYYNVKIGDITKDCNFSIGTFYNYFEKKEQFLEEITNQIGTSILFFLKLNTENINSVFEKHITYMLLNMTFFENYTYKYQLIRETEFVSKNTSQNLFNNLEKLYIDSFSKTDYNFEEKKLISNFLMGITHYMGIELFFTKNFNDKFSLIEQLPFYLKNGINNEKNSSKKII